MEEGGDRKEEDAVMDERRRVGGMRLSCRGLSPAREREYAAWVASFYVGPFLSWVRCGEER